MKKIIWVIPVLALAAVFSAFTLRGQNAEKAMATDMHFEYDLSNVPDISDPSDYLDADNWTFRTSPPSTCGIAGSATCFITIPAATLSSFSGSNESKLVQFLAEQDGEETDAFPDVIEAVETLRGNHTKVGL
ncbi:MAG: hypothetical protein KA821_01380 [Chitinophagaceae bacterium]|nr:hypothetical protein [Chitinophagaceae bacterium]